MLVRLARLRPIRRLLPLRIEIAAQTKSPGQSCRGFLLGPPINQNL